MTYSLTARLAPFSFHLVEMEWNEIFAGISFGGMEIQLQKSMFGCHKDFYIEMTPNSMCSFNLTVLLGNSVLYMLVERRRFLGWWSGALQSDMFVRSTCQARANLPLDLRQYVKEIKVELRSEVYYSCTRSSDDVGWNPRGRSFTIWRAIPEEHEEHDEHKRGKTLKSTRFDYTCARSKYTKRDTRSKSNKGGYTVASSSQSVRK